MVALHAGETEVGDPELALMVDQEVRRLDVPVQDAGAGGRAPALRRPARPASATARMQSRSRCEESDSKRWTCCGEGGASIDPGRPTSSEPPGDVDPRTEVDRR